jgi:hypothetical protein
MTTPRIVTTYQLTDGNASEEHDTLIDAASAAEDWYEYLLDLAEGEVCDELRTAIHSADFDGSDDSVGALNSAIGEWEGRIAEACGKQDFHGHGTYHVSAADSMGLSLVCTAITRPVCASGDVTHESCQWSGDASDLVEIEYMPEVLRSSHIAAGNSGCYPANGAIRICVCPECAEELVDGEWCREVE